MISYLVSMAVRSGFVLVGIMLTQVQSSTIGVTEVGYFSVGYALLLGISTLSRYGLGISLIKTAGALDISVGRVPVLLCFVKGAAYAFVFSIACTLVFLVLYSFLGVGSLFNYPPSGSFEYLLLGVPFNSVLVIYGSYLRVVDRPNMAAFFESSGVLLFVVVEAYLSVLLGVRLNLVDYSLFYLASSFLLFVVAIFCFIGDMSRHSVQFPRFRQAEFLKGADILSGGTSYALLDLISFSTYYGVYFVISFILSPEEAGIFVVAYRISSVFGFISVAINGVTVARFSKMLASKEIEQLNRLCNSVLGFSLLIGGPMLLCLALFDHAILAIFDIDSTKLNAGLVLLILIFGQFLGLFSGGAATLVSMSSSQDRLRHITMTALFLNIVVTFTLGYFFGVVGAALGVAGALAYRSFRIYFLVPSIFGFSILPRLR